MDEQQFRSIETLYDSCTRIRKAYHPDKPVFIAKCERSKGYLYSIGLIAYGTIGSYKEFDLIEKVLNNLPEFLEAYAEKHGLDLTEFEPHNPSRD